MSGKFYTIWDNSFSRGPKDGPDMHSHKVSHVAKLWDHLGFVAKIETISIFPMQMKDILCSHKSEKSGKVGKQQSRRWSGFSDNQAIYFNKCIFFLFLLFESLYYAYKLDFIQM